jgi:hypothetical protein
MMETMVVVARVDDAVVDVYVKNAISLPLLPYYSGHIVT